MPTLHELTTKLAGRMTVAELADELGLTIDNLLERVTARPPAPPKGSPKKKTTKAKKTSRKYPDQRIFEVIVGHGDWLNTAKLRALLPGLGGQDARHACDRLWKAEKVERRKRGTKAFEYRAKKEIGTEIVQH